MIKEQVRELVRKRADQDGLIETGVDGVQIFRLTEPVSCAPVVYEPSLVAIVSGSKEAVLDGRKHEYDSSHYFCCSMSLPVEAGAPSASPEKPLMGVYVSLDTQVMAELVIEMESAADRMFRPRAANTLPGVALARWDDDFSHALLRLLQLGDSPSDTRVLGNSRLRELYYCVLKGEAGNSARRAFSVDNKIARSIEYLSSSLDEKFTIEQMASYAGMSRAVFHRKFKQATSMSPIQFVKSMRLNSAAMKINTGMSVNQAALEVGYISFSQFSREFKRLYGQSPRKWSNSSESLVREYP